MHPGPTGEHAVSRWTAPQAGRVAVKGKFGAGNVGRVDVHVFHNGRSLFSALNTEKDEPFALEIEVKKGDAIDFDVGAGRNGYFAGATPVEAAIIFDGEKNGSVEVFGTPNRASDSVPAPAPASAPPSPSQQEKRSAKPQPVKPEPMSRFYPGTRIDVMASSLDAKLIAVANAPPPDNGPPMPWVRGKTPTILLAVPAT